MSAPPSGRHQVRGWGEALGYLALGTLATLALAEAGFRLLEPVLGAATGVGDPLPDPDDPLRRRTQLALIPIGQKGRIFCVGDR